MLTGHRFDPSNEVLDVYLLPFGAVLKEEVLVDVADAKLGQHLSQVWKLDELVFLPLATNVATRLEPGPEDLLVPQKFGTDEWQHSPVSLLECSIGSSQMVKPGVEIDDSLVLLV